MRTSLAGRKENAARRMTAGLPGFPVLPIAHQIIHHRWVGQGRGVAEIAILVLSDLAQDAAHYLARACLRQARCELDEVGLRDGADLLAHPLQQLLAQLLVWLLAAH